MMNRSNELPSSLSRTLPFAAFLVLGGCATATPVELTNARLAYGRASTGPAAQVTPTDVHKAKVALDKAEKTFAEEEDSQRARDYAYVAERTAQIAEARAEAIVAEKKGDKANQELGDKKDALAKETQGALTKTREQLSESERGQGAERAAREEADKKAVASEQKAVASEQKAAASELKAKEANDALAKLAAKEDERGTVITLSGSVLFRSNDATLMPSAQERLDQVAQALVAKGQEVTVEGHTDSQGKQSTNMNLSQRRAESVRGYLISRGFPAEKILARGIGPDRPIAENQSAEGRANNRRVEIVIAKSAGRIN